MIREDEPTEYIYAYIMSRRESSPPTPTKKRKDPSSIGIRTPFNTNWAIVTDAMCSGFKTSKEEVTNSPWTCSPYIEQYYPESCLVMFICLTQSRCYRMHVVKCFSQCIKVSVNLKISDTVYISVSLLRLGISWRVPSNRYCLSCHSSRLKRET